MDNSSIKIVDSPPGTYKTTWAIEYINSLPEDIKVIYITPFLSEVDRIKESCKGKCFTAPDRRFGEGTKRGHLLKLIYEEKNIVSTHSLFSNIDDELITALKQSDYILILDEVMNVLEKFDMWDESNLLDEDGVDEDEKTKGDIESLVNKGVIEIEPITGLIHWVDNENKWYKYEKIKNLARRELLYFIDNCVVMWTFPIDVFRNDVFNEIYILTYQFDYQIQAAYYKFFNLEYKKYNTIKTDDNLIITETVGNEHEQEWKKRIASLIHILDNPKLNRVGTIESRRIADRQGPIPLTKTWYIKNRELVKKVKKNLDNFFSNYTNVSNKDKMWTCFVDDKHRLSGKYVSKKNWLPINARATNDFGNKKALAYAINRYLNPHVIHFFSNKNIKLDQDKYALSELIQWIWRSAIRNGEEVLVYIPSHRMRVLLQKYLNNEEIEY